MKYLLSHKIFATTLSVLVLLSTFSFTVEKHYCGDTLIDTAVFSEVKGCGMDMEAVSKKKKPCCKDEVDVIEGQDELNRASFDDLEFSTHLFIATYAYSCVSLFESLPKQIIPNKDYSPPNIVYDIQLLEEVFLI
ncbi:hypothetical protein BTO05_11900 [Winogradskyella sp. PC-19]|uniref:HYC_CC_PP family protein n=1 Tax=unclassified Winogradskyella TaxID=2615021 RepID=UPI000B3CD452|nr:MULTISPECIES: hypothetical protein [unclassified Winogradskyella]ARV10308.1 hypothetical protein BTO05_11900 [Winogradskyella sp. PC-19]